MVTTSRAPSTEASARPGSIFDRFSDNAARRPTSTAVLVKEDGVYRARTWADLATEVDAISSGLAALGFEAGQHACITSNTRLEWVLCDLGIMGAGGVTVPIYPSLLPEECQYITENSDAVIVFAEDAEQAAKFRSQRERLPHVKRVIQISGTPVGSDDWVISLADLKKAGRGDPEELVARRAALSGESTLTIIYTSGTTGRPKGVVLTHANLMSQAEWMEADGVLDEDDVQLLFLPLAHSLGKALEIAWLAVPHVLAFAESLQTIRENLGEVRPTVMAGVPRIYEKFYSAVVQKATAPGGLKSRLFMQGLELSQKNGELEEQGRSLGLIDGVKFMLLKRVIFGKIREGLNEILGGRMRGMISGGAPLSKKIAWFFRDAGLVITEGYGLTETSPVLTFNPLGAQRIGTVGKALPNTEIRIAPDGEILVRGPQIMKGYYENPEATRETIDDDGWLHTGDVGHLDRDGYLRITDRKKDILITAGGKNVAPQNIENQLKTHRLISQVVVYGDQRRYLTALVTLDPDALAEFCRNNDLGEGPHAELTQKPEVRAEIDRAVRELNAQLASFETIKKFSILGHDFSVESGELTPSLKVKRKVIADRYRDTFEAFYDEP